jgi:putative DNA primase/helicase
VEEMNEELLAPIEEVCEVFEDDTASDAAKADTELPSLNHADLAKDFLASECGKNFYRVYDVSDGPVASWTGTRWVIADDTDLLRSGVRDYLDRLHDSMPKPEKGPDYRAKLKSAPFCRDVTTEVIIKLPPIKREAFDSDEYTLGLPDGMVAELRTGAIRPMRREDFISQRLYLKTDFTKNTSRFDRFLDEITLGNAELKTFILRLCALCLTAHPFQGLFFFWGRGRNGKGVLLRLLASILGRGFTATFRPNELTVSKYDEDKAKRSLNKLEGTRLATVDESLGSNLNLPLLKLMSGGDVLSAARMRQDDRQFKPSHKLVLPTNEKPDLPNDPAFRGRVYFVPFLADYSDRAKQDPELETTLAAEAAGILAQLITLCPDVIANGLKAPKTITDATSELLEENDLAKQFQEDMLTATPGKNISFDVMQDAAQTWLIGGAAGLTVRTHGQNRQAERIMAELKASYAYKRLRPEGKNGRRMYFFLNVALVEQRE